MTQYDSWLTSPKTIVGAGLQGHFPLVYSLLISFWLAQNQLSGARCSDEDHRICLSNNLRILEDIQTMKEEEAFLFLFSAKQACTCRISKRRLRRPRRTPSSSALQQWRQLHARWERIRPSLHETKTCNFTQCPSNHLVHTVRVPPTSSSLSIGARARPWSARTPTVDFAHASFFSNHILVLSNYFLASGSSQKPGGKKHIRTNSPVRTTSSLIWTELFVRSENWQKNALRRRSFFLFLFH